jgi:hypothetical protein
MKKTITFDRKFPKKDSKGTKIRWEDVSSIAIEGIQAASFLEVIESVLVDKFRVNILRDFPCPNVSSPLDYTNTYNTIKSFNTVILLYKLCLCSLKDTNAGLSSYKYVVTLMNKTKVPLNPSLVMPILKEAMGEAIGEAIGNDLLSRWFKKAANKFESSNTSYTDPMKKIHSISKKIRGKIISFIIL